VFVLAKWDLIEDEQGMLKAFTVEAERLLPQLPVSADSATRRRRSTAGASNRNTWPRPRPGRRPS
jgi:predicted GTPase